MMSATNQFLPCPNALHIYMNTRTELESSLPYVLLEIRMDDRQGLESFSFFCEGGHVMDSSAGSCPLWWDWQLGHSVAGADDAVVVPPPPASVETFAPYHDHHLLSQDPFDQDDLFLSAFLSEIEQSENLEEETISERERVVVPSRCRDQERVLTFEEVSRYFYMPITRAARELGVGLTLLKKKCRELGIPRWPHRKMKSLQTLINNVQELGNAAGGEAAAGEALQLRRAALEVLERERRLMEKEPAVEMEEKTKRLRQACFKANYKKRRLMQQASFSSSSSSSSSSSLESGDSSHRLRLPPPPPPRG